MNLSLIQKKTKSSGRSIKEISEIIRVTFQNAPYAAIFYISSLFIKFRPYKDSGDITIFPASPITWHAATREKSAPRACRSLLSISNENILTNQHNESTVIIISVSLSSILINSHFQPEIIYFLFEPHRNHKNF